MTDDELSEDILSIDKTEFNNILLEFEESRKRPREDEFEESGKHSCKDVSSSDETDYDDILLEFEESRKHSREDIICYCGRNASSICDAHDNIVYVCSDGTCTLNIRVSKYASGALRNMTRPPTPPETFLPEVMIPQEQPGYPDNTINGHIDGEYAGICKVNGKTVVSVDYPVTVEILELAYTMGTSLMAGNRSIHAKQATPIPDKDDWFNFRTLLLRVVDSNNNVKEDVLKRFAATLVSKIMSHVQWRNIDMNTASVDNDEVEIFVRIFAKAFAKEPGFVGIEECLKGHDSEEKKAEFRSVFGSNQFGVAKLVYQVLSDIVSEQYFDKETQDFMKLGSFMETSITNDFLEAMPHMTMDKDLNVASEEAGVFYYHPLPFITCSPDQILTVTHRSNRPVFPFEKQRCITTNTNLRTNLLRCTRYYVEYKTMSKRFNGVPMESFAKYDRKWIGREFYRVKKYLPETDFPPIIPDNLTVRLPSARWEVNGRSYNMPKDYYIQMLCNMNIIPGIEYGLMVQYSNNLFRVIGVENDPDYWNNTIVPRLCYVFKRIYLPFMVYNINKHFEQLAKTK